MILYHILLGCKNILLLQGFRYFGEKEKATQKLQVNNWNFLTKQPMPKSP